MPLYEYECDACGHRFEVIQKFSDAPVETCPSCGGRVHKMQSAPAIQFKGTGWYITDYAKKDSGGGKADTARSGKKDGSSQTSGGESSGSSDAGQKGSSDAGSSGSTPSQSGPSTPSKSSGSSGTGGGSSTSS